MSKDIYSEICVHFGIDSVKYLVANRRNRLINNYAETDDYLFMSNVAMFWFVCLAQFFYCDRLSSVCCIC